MSNINDNNTRKKLPENWTQCMFIIERKGRYCNLGRVNDSLYCGAHRPLDDIVNSESRATRHAQYKGMNVERVQCPVDPTHTIYKHRLNNHIKICNAKTRNNIMKQQLFYCKNCNSSSTTSNNDSDDDNDYGSNSNSNSNVILEPVDPDVLVNKIKACFATFLNINIDPNSNTNGMTCSTTDNIEATITTAIAKTQTSHNKTRHIKQDALIINVMSTTSLLSLSNNNDTINDNVSYVELGAGKGVLGISLKVVKPSINLVLVERSGCRGKAENKLINSKKREIGISTSSSSTASGSRLGLGIGMESEGFFRVRMDIRHCYIPCLPGVLLENDKSSNTSQTPAFLPKGKDVVIIAKHLCGVATDLALRSLLQYHVNDSNTNNPCAKGVSIATCCHHAMNYDDYTGIDFYTSHGFTRGDFEVMKYWSGWNSIKTEYKKRSNPATNNDNDNQNDDENDDHNDDHNPPTNTVRPSNIDREEMANIGYMIKRVFDQGRIEFLKTIGYNARQLKYCDKKLTPECVIIIAEKM